MATITSTLLATNSATSAAPIHVPLRPASLEDEVAALPVAMLGKAADKWGSERARVGQGRGGGE